MVDITRYNGVLALWLSLYLEEEEALWSAREEECRMSDPLP